ncbi:hypothetical protein PH210_22555 [Paenibacillus sp. BSR1-1]|uniref:hypothetical protein n=1 Tax=Paenibacillus sp. BSR1-1 TaxID=3020845 RepID=UPI0025AFCD9B|nr:hypothetical protein [Paenibacillus sp. BSR1-1]MDN3018957.1 hypothetical protein [Paenibacillus sp. BSR1-1]
MRKYSGIFSILILIAIFVIFKIPHAGELLPSWSFWFVLIFGFASAVIASWYSPSGFWRKASAAILIMIPVGYLVVFILFIIGITTSSGF